MPVRYPTVAGMFYPADRDACREEMKTYLRGAMPVDVPSPVLGGVVPHAGWVFSGATAARVFAALNAEPLPETIVLFGAVHSWGVTRPSMYGSGVWRTPIGDVSVDEELAQAVLRTAGNLIVNQPEAHAHEHSIEVQLPFIAYLFPSARILPIAVPPLATAHEVGHAVARAARELGRRAPAIGSSDLTHYGPRYGLAPVGVGQRALQWTKENDARILELIIQMRAADVVIEAEAHSNACGAGAIAAARRSSRPWACSASS